MVSIIKLIHTLIKARNIKTIFTNIINKPCNKKGYCIIKIGEMNFLARSCTIATL